MGRTKVLHIINGEFYSGAERVQDLLAIRLPEFGYDCGFACLKPRLFPEKRNARNVPLHDVSMRSKLDLSVIGKISEIVRGEGYSLLHTHTPRAALMGRLVAGKCNIPFVHHVHSPTQRDTESTFRNIINARIENWSLSRASRLITVSRSLAAHMQSIGFNRALIAVVPNGVAERSMETNWTPPTGDWVLGMVALFRPRKGLEVLLEAVARLRANGQRVRIHAVGAFESLAYEQSIHALMQRLGLAPFITWTGFTSDVTKEFSRMNAFVLPSLFGEGLPMVIIEAMSAGLPVIGTAVEGIPEILENEAGIVVEAANSSALADGIMRLMTMPEHEAAKLARVGNTRQRDFYSDTAMASGVSKIYRDVLGQ